jgi:hypothetical protein
MKEAIRGSAVAVALLVGATLAAAPAPAHAGGMGPHGEIGGAHKFGLGGHIGTDIGPSLKFWFPGGLGLNIDAGFNHWYYGASYGLLAEAVLIWHFSIVEKPKWEMLIGPGVGGGIGYWRNWGGGIGDLCQPSTRGPDDCIGPYAKGIFHWSMLFHPWRFDVFAEPGLAFGVGIPGFFFFDFQFHAGVRYYF